MKKFFATYLVCFLVILLLSSCTKTEQEHLTQRNREDINQLKIEIAELKRSIEELVIRFNEIAPPDKRIKEKITEGRIKSLLHSLGSDDFLTRYNAGKELKEIGKPAIPYLVESLKSKNAKERMGAIVVLGEIKDSEVVPPLIQAFKESRHKKEKSTMALVLGKIGDRRASSVLLEALDDPSTTIQASSATALGMLKEEKAIPKLVTLYRKGDENMRNCIQRAIRRIGDESFSEFKEILKTSSPENKLTVINILDNMRFEDESTKLLKEALKDENPYIQLYAAVALSRRSDASSLTIAEKYINSRNEEIRNLCEQIIRNLGGRGDENSR